jgi:Zn-dependent protease/CBS domain-containing protein
MNQSIRLGRVAGISVGVNWSVLLIAALIGWTLSGAVLPEIVPGEPGWAYAVAGVLGALAFFGSLLAHELAHAVVARRDGVEVEDITLWLLGGVSRLGSEPTSAESELRIAVAGPLTSLALALVFGAIEVFGEAVGLPDVALGTLAWLAVVNVMLGLFNLLPAYPLDGGRALRALAWRRRHDRLAATRIAVRTGHVVAWMLIGLGLLAALTGSVVSGLWLVLIGWFVDNAGRAEGDAVRQRAVLGSVVVGGLMSPDPVTVPDDLSVERLVQDYVLGHHHSAFPVIDGLGRVVGLVGLDQVRKVPADRRGDVTVGQVAMPLEAVPVVGPADSGVIGLQRLGSSGVGRALVIDSTGNLVGILSNADLARALDVGPAAASTRDSSGLSGGVIAVPTTARVVPPPPIPPSRR